MPLRPSRSYITLVRSLFERAIPYINDGAQSPILANFESYAFGTAITGSALPGGFVLTRSGVRAAVNYATPALAEESLFPTNTAAIGVAPNGLAGLTLDRAAVGVGQNPNDLTNATIWPRSGTVVVASVGAGPGGTTLAFRQSNIAVTREGCIADPVPAVAAFHCGSVWVRRNASNDASEIQVILIDDAKSVNGQAVYKFATGVDIISRSAWRIINVRQLLSVSPRMYLGESNNYTSQASYGGGKPSATMDYEVFLPTLEAGKYQSDPMPSRARNGERLTLPSTASAFSRLFRSGRLGMYAKVSMKGSSVDFATDFYFAIDANDATSFVKFDKTTRLLTISIGGVTNVTTLPLYWIKWDLMEIWIAAGGGVASKVSYRLAIDGVVQAPTLMTLTGSALGSWTPSGNVDFLCNGTANQLSAIVHKIDDAEPSWTSTVVALSQLTCRYMPWGDSNTQGYGSAPEPLCWRNRLGAFFNPVDYPNFLSVGPADGSPAGTNNTTARYHGGILGETALGANVKTQGLNGSNFPDLSSTWYFAPQGPYSPDLIIYSFGTNDTEADAGASGFINTIRMTVSTILTNLPHTRFVFLGLVYANGVTDPAVETRAAAHNAALISDLIPWLDSIGVVYEFVNMRVAAGPGSGVGWDVTDYADDYHMSAAGHLKAYDLIRPAVLRVLSVGR